MQFKRRCYTSKDWHARERVNIIGAIIDFKLFNVCLFDCYINAGIFYTWVSKELLTNTPNNSVIILNNDTLQAVEQAGHTVEFLPPYSPNLNPTEKK